LNRTIRCPGHYPTVDFSGLCAARTPHIPLDAWALIVMTKSGTRDARTRPDLTQLPAELVSVDIHCLTRWSKVDTNWRGMSFDRLLVAGGRALRDPHPLGRPASPIRA
jgi:DMSO/TMAO reductase YedYZ molybdopterin-dependent catalytic subunit